MLEDHCFSFWACADPGDWDVEKVFDGRDVVLRSLGEVLVGSDLSDILVPAGGGELLEGKTISLLLTL